ncbi:HlyD family secretion protein [Thiotrichales bacterium 19X7-9]|nr:HlyD family secretion protein [Thiotrichales bacterium 19X7-9]
MQSFVRFINKYRFVIGVLLTLLIGYCIYFYFYFSPITDNAFVVANVRPIASEVSGVVEKVYVKNAQKVKVGDLLFELDPTPYQLAVNSKKHALAIAGFELQEGQLKLRDLKERIKIQKNIVAKIREDYVHAQVLVKSGAVTKTKYDDLSLSYQSELSKLEISKNALDLFKIKLQQLQQKKDQAQAELQLAQYHLKETKVYAKTDGIVTNLFISKGYPVTALKPIFSFIDTDHWWVQANFKETDLAHVKVGQKVAIRLRMYLGSKIYYGQVVSTNWAVSRQYINPTNYLQEVPNENQWILLPQRFPVLIKIDQPDKNYPLHMGASAYVSIDT